jgi:hypothetical protein
MQPLFWSAWQRSAVLAGVAHNKVIGNSLGPVEPSG